MTILSKNTDKFHTQLNYQQKRIVHLLILCIFNLAEIGFSELLDPGISKILWAKEFQFKSRSENYYSGHVEKIVVDGEGNSFVVGVKKIFSKEERPDCRKPRDNYRYPSSHVPEQFCSFVSKIDRNGEVVARAPIASMQSTDSLIADEAYTAWSMPARVFPPTLEEHLKKHEPIIRLDSLGNVYVGNRFKEQKFDSNLNLLWKRDIDSTTIGGSPFIVDSEGNTYLANNSSSFVKLDTNGNISWISALKNCFPGISYADFYEQPIPTSYALNKSGSEIYLTGPGPGLYYTVSKLDTKTGKLLWKKRLSYNGWVPSMGAHVPQVPLSLSYDPYGNLYLIGSTNGNFEGLGNAAVRCPWIAGKICKGEGAIALKLRNSDGKVLWKARIGKGEIGMNNIEVSSHLESFGVDGVGNLYIAASTWDTVASSDLADSQRREGPTHKFLRPNEKLTIYKFSEGGKIQWKKRYKSFPFMPGTSYTKFYYPNAADYLLTTPGKCLPQNEHTSSKDEMFVLNLFQVDTDGYIHLVGQNYEAKTVEINETLRYSTGKEIKTFVVKDTICRYEPRFNLSKLDSNGQEISNQSNSGFIRAGAFDSNRRVNLFFGLYPQKLYQFEME